MAANPSHAKEARNQMTATFVPIVCPNCGGDMMIASDLAKACCNYCGKAFLVTEAGSHAAGPSFEDLMSLADTATKAGNGAEAYGLYTRALELSPSSYEAWYGKGYSTLQISTPDAPRLEEAETYLREAIRRAPTAARAKVEGLTVETLAYAYGSHALLAIKRFQDVSENWEWVDCTPEYGGVTFENLDARSRRRDELMATYLRLSSERHGQWGKCIQLVVPLLVKVDALLPSIQDSLRMRQLLRDLSDACEFLLSEPSTGVVMNNHEGALHIVRDNQKVPVTRLRDDIGQWQGRLGTKPLTQRAD